MEGVHMTSPMAEVTVDTSTEWQKDTEWQLYLRVFVLPNTQKHI